jgi:hypothetical protein
LVNNPEFNGGSKAHDHDTEVQILTGEEDGPARVPQVLKRKATLEILVRGQKGVIPRDSFYHHVPDLAHVIANATPAIRGAGRGDPNRDLIQNVVTVDGGIVRVRDVTVWEQGGYPLSGDPDEVGQRATSPAAVKFMGSTVRGHIATEVVVEIDADQVDLKCDHDNRFKGTKKGSAKPKDPHIPAETVEILISSFERPADKPAPWGLDFQWLFEAAGYREAELASPEFDDWVRRGQAFDSKLFNDERRMFLRGEKNTRGRPFPYIESARSLTPLQPLTNYPKILVCVHGLMAAPDTTISHESVVLPDGTTRLREWQLEPDARAAEASTKGAPAKAPVMRAAPKKGGAKEGTPKKEPAKKAAGKRTVARRKKPGRR